MTDQPTFAHVETTTTVVYTYQISGAAPLERRYSLTAFTFIPERANVTFTNGDCTHMVISGHHTKKDGTAGDSIHENKYWPERGVVPDDMPGWAVPLTDPNHARTAITEAEE